MNFCPWWSRARDPQRPAEPRAGISTDRSCARKTARRLRGASPVDLGTRCVDFSSSPSPACEKIESSHALLWSGLFWVRPHSALYGSDSFCPPLSQRLLLTCFDISFFQGLAARYFFLSGLLTALFPFLLGKGPIRNSGTRGGWFYSKYVV